jgi:DNA-directed RNA polymerase alpha subunit
MIDVLLRDQIAIAAMQAMVMRGDTGNISERAYAQADEMLEVKVKPSPSAWLKEDPVLYLELPKRVANCVRSQHIKTMEELLDTRAHYWLTRVPNMGAMSAKQLFAAIEKRGLKLKS